MRAVIRDILAEREQALPIDVIVRILELRSFEISLIFERWNTFILFILMIRKTSERVCPRPSMGEGRDTGGEAFCHGTCKELAGLR